MAVYIAQPQHPYQPYQQQDTCEVSIGYIDDYLQLPLADGIAPKLEAYVEMFASWPSNALDGLFEDPFYHMADKIYNLQIYYDQVLTFIEKVLNLIKI